MLKIAVFDDEYIILQGLKKMIYWEQYGIELVGTAANGYEAISLFLEQRPDIVLTDIRMPGIDGLQVIEKIMSEAPETMCIVFSGFNEVKYLKKAIKLGVIDYLEKPITLPIIEDVIKRTLEKITEKRRVEKLEVNWRRSYSAHLEKATLDLLLLGDKGVANWETVFGGKSKQIVSVTVFAFSNDTTSIIDHQDCHTVRVHNGPENLLVVFHYSRYVDAVIKYLTTNLEKGNAGLGRTYNNLEETYKSYNEAIHALKYGIFLNKVRLIKFEEILHTPLISEDISNYEKAVLTCLRTTDELSLPLKVNEFVNKLEEQKLNREMMESEILNLIYLSLEVVKETGADFNSFKGTGYFPQQEIREIETWIDMKNWLYQQLEMIMQWVINIHNENKLGVIAKACVYIEQFCNEGITLQEVAEHVKMNPSYFSHLFKGKMGMTYIQYLTHIRMEKAKEMLLNGAKVIDVSEKVGYHSYRHFSDLFKKYVGVNPSEFKNTI